MLCVELAYEDGVMDAKIGFDSILRKDEELIADYAGAWIDSSVAVDANRDRISSQTAERCRTGKVQWDITMSSPARPTTFLGRLPQWHIYPISLSRGHIAQ